MSLKKPRQHDAKDIFTQNSVPANLGKPRGLIAQNSNTYRWW